MHINSVIIEKTIIFNNRFTFVTTGSGYFGNMNITTDQVLIFGVLVVTLVLFAWNKWRYDVVAIMALLFVALTGLVPPQEVFSGLGHPAVVTVAAVLIISRGLLNSGLVDTMARYLIRVGKRPWIQVATLTAIVALFSGFINNVGALALFIPVAIWMSRQSGSSPSLLLMPIAFGSLLGGTLTLIGTPPNIIIASYRGQYNSSPFGMFDFLPVGLAITLGGVLLISIIGWRLIPQRKKHRSSPELFEIGDYLTELIVLKGSKFSGRLLHDLYTAIEGEVEVVVLGLIRCGQLKELPSVYEVLQDEDILLVEADSNELKRLIEKTGLRLAHRADIGKDKVDTGLGDLHLAEVIVTPGSSMIGRTATALDLRNRYGINILAVARQGTRLRERLRRIRYVAGDILLIQAHEDALQPALNELGCLPLASRGLSFGKPRKIILAGTIFVTAIMLIVFNLIPPAIALVGASLVMLLSGVITPSEVYKSIDMSVIVLLAALIPVGQALENTGGSDLIANTLLEIARTATPQTMLVILIIAVMLLSNVINNAAAAVLAAPIAIKLATGLQVSVDPFLMAVAIGASCAFLTPIGHQSNTLVMVPGGYKFGDYWRLGLPLSILVVAISIPVIMWFWPL